MEKIFIVTLVKSFDGDRMEITNKVFSTLKAAREYYNIVFTEIVSEAEDSEDEWEWEDNFDSSKSAIAYNLENDAEKSQVQLFEIEV